MAEVEIVREGHVARVVLNRPEKLNSLTEPMWGGLVRAFRELDADPSVRQNDDAPPQSEHERRDRRIGRRKRLSDHRFEKSHGLPPSRPVVRA